MSTSSDTMFKCPYCGKEFEITIYPAVTADKDPELRERSMSGDIFHHSCPHCHKDYLVQNDMLYTDANHKFAILVSSVDPGTSMKSFAEPLVKAGWKLRRCASVKEFTEKITIFEDGLDDAMVELAKYDSLITFMEGRKGSVRDITSIEYHRTDDGVIKINMRMNDKGMTFYNPVSELEEEMKLDADLFAVDDTTFPLINHDWIISLYTEPEGRA